MTVITSRGSAWAAAVRRVELPVPVLPLLRAVDVPPDRTPGAELAHGEPRDAGRGDLPVLRPVPRVRPGFLLAGEHDLDGPDLAGPRGVDGVDDVSWRSAPGHHGHIF